MLRQEQKRLGDRAVSVQYEDYIFDNYGLSQIESFLGKSFDWVEVQKIISKKLKHWFASFLLSPNSKPNYVYYLIFDNWIVINLYQWLKLQVDIKRIF